MRLICPNCSAQYEVDDAVIPDQGRDVQCSNCGHTWFQASPNAPVEDEPEPEIVDITEEAEEAPAAPLAPPPRKDLDPEVASILREEAKREAAARRAEAETLETQPELGIEEEAESQAAERTAAARARMARLRGGDEGGYDAEAALAGLAAAAGSRKELLPDVEEINDSLRPAEAGERKTQEPDDIAIESVIPEAEPETKRGGAGRLIFWLIVLLMLIALGVYVFAPQIAELVPAAAPILVQYVDAVNGLRETVDPMIAGLVQQVQDLIAGFTGGE